MEVTGMLKIVVDAANEKKAEDLVIQDLRGLSDICQFQVICTGNSARQVQAIADSVEDTVKKSFGMKALAVEGKKVGAWVLLDYPEFMVHVFEANIRRYYALEELWPKAKVFSVE